MFTKKDDTITKLKKKIETLEKQKSEEIDFKNGYYAQRLELQLKVERLDNYGERYKALYVKSERELQDIKSNQDEEVQVLMEGIETRDEEVKVLIEDYEAKIRNIIKESRQEVLKHELKLQDQELKLRSIKILEKENEFLNKSFGSLQDAFLGNVEVLVKLNDGITKNITIEDVTKMIEASKSNTNIDCSKK